MAYHRIDDQFTNYPTYDTDAEYGRAYSLKDQLYDVLQYEKLFTKEEQKDQE